MPKIDWTKVGQDGAPKVIEKLQVTLPQVVLVPIKEIKVGNRLRDVNETKVLELAESIQHQGLLNPLLIDSGKNLVAGKHRLEALKLNRWDQVPCIISDKTDTLDLELQQIDENLVREELHYTDRGNFLKRRKEIYELKHPETKLGAGAKVRPRDENGTLTKMPDSGKLVKTAPTFTEETTQKTGLSKTIINEEVQIARDVIPEAQPILKEQDRPKQEALHLARQTPAIQKKVTELMPERPKTPVKNLVKEVKNEVKREEILKTLPEPVLRSEDITMYWGDAFKALANPGIIKPGSIPLIVTSPPYGIGKDEGDYEDWSGDNWTEKFDHFLKLAKRALTPGGILAVVLGTQPREFNHVTEYLPLDIQAIVLARETHDFALIRRVAWTFNAGVPNNSHLNGRYETICFLAKGPGYYFNPKTIKVPPKTEDPRNPPDGVDPSDVWYFERVTNVEKDSKGLTHPCIYPSELVERIIKLCSKEGDLVLDPFSGSGTTLQVASGLGRKAIGIEINKNCQGDVRIRLGSTAYAQEDIS